MNSTETQPLPSLPQLLKATAVAAIAATTLLVSVVLPAEYGVDPIGIGKVLGLSRLRSPGPSKPAEPVNAESPAVLTQRSAPFRNDEISIVLKPGEGAEIKATMNKSDRFMYSWTAEGGPVDFDMHGEEFNAPAGDYTSFSKKKQQTNDNGAFIAPFDGIHGWYWANKGTSPVTVIVKTSGFYEKLAKQ
jgi:hypothetical protein